MNIPHLSRYRHGEFLQYMLDFSELLNKKNVKALHLFNQKSALDAVLVKIEEICRQSRSNGTTNQEVVALDERRDRAVVGLKAITAAYTYHFDQDKVDAGFTLHDNIVGHHNYIQKLSYQEERVVLNNIITDWEEKKELKRAIKILELEQWHSELKEVNTGLSAKCQDESNGEVQYPSKHIVELRAEAIDLYRIVVNHIKAHITLGTSDAYQDMINQIDVLAGQYNQLVENRHANNATDTDASTTE